MKYIWIFPLLCMLSGCEMIMLRDMFDDPEFFKYDKEKEEKVTSKPKEEDNLVIFFSQ